MIPGTRASTVKAPPHWPQLDGLRCLAVLAVIWAHTMPLAAAWAGPYGVRLFFVLSAFLITGILLGYRDDVRTGRHTLRSALRTFYMRRTLRIFPVYYVFLAVLWLIDAPAIRAEWPWHAFYLTNWFVVVRETSPPVVAHLWSLAVEEQFYLAWPLLLLLAPARRLPSLFLGAAGLAIITRALVVLVTIKAPAWTTPTIVCLDSLGLGAVLGWHRHVAPDARGLRDRWLHRAALVGGGLLVMVWGLAAVGRGWKIIQITELAAVSLVAVWIIGRAADGITGWAGALLSWRPARYLGTISYGMYLFHPVLVWGVQRWGDRHPMAQSFTDGGLVLFVGITVATVAVAALSWYALERPMNALKDRVVDRRRPAMLEIVEG